MAKKITRSELNASFYDKIDVEIGEIKKIGELNNQKLNEVKRRLTLIDQDYFSQVIEEINQTIGVQSLYLNNSLTDDEKFFTIKSALKEYLEEINLIIDQKIEVVDNFEDIFILDNNEIATSVQEKLEELMQHLSETMNLKTLNQATLNSFERFYPGLSKNLLIIDDKYEKEKDGGIPYQERLNKIKVENKALITKIKKHLNSYKIKWVWYVVVVILLIVGILATILVPIFFL